MLTKAQSFQSVGVGEVDQVLGLHEVQIFSCWDMCVCGTFHFVMNHGLLFWGALPRQYKDFQVAAEDY
jgi:hypothetical protein